MSKMTPELWQEVSPYLDQALAMSRKKRAAWLESLEKTNPRLATLIKELLEHQRLAKQEHFLE